MLKSYDWPGNVRKLEHAIQRAVIVCQGQTIQIEDLTLERPKEDGVVEERLSPEEYERRYIREALEKTGWVIKGAYGAAAFLGIPESTLRGRMKNLGIVRS